MAPKVALLEKILLFVDVDKLEVAIKGTTMVADLDRCFTTPTRPTKPLKLELNSSLTPCKAPLPLPLDHVVNEDKSLNCMRLPVEFSISVDDDDGNNDSVANDTFSMVRTEDDAEEVPSTEDVDALEAKIDEVATASITNQDFEVLQAQIDELNDAEMDRFWQELDRSMQGWKLLSIRPQLQYQLLRITHLARGGFDVDDD